MISREQRTPLSEWWWTVDRLQLAAIIALMLAGIILSLAASPPVAARVGVRPVPLLQPARPVPGAFLDRDDRGVVPVAAIDPAQRADHLRDLDRADRGDL